MIRLLLSLDNVGKLKHVISFTERFNIEKSRFMYLNHFKIDLKVVPGIRSFKE